MNDCDFFTERRERRVTDSNGTVNACFEVVELLAGQVSFFRQTVEMLSAASCSRPPGTANQCYADSRLFFPLCGKQKRHEDDVKLG